MYFKILRKDLTSVGLLGAQRMQYRFGFWNRPLEPLSKHPRKGGGLWVVNSMSHAKSVKRYLWKEHRPRIAVRIFRCRIGKVLCLPTSYRTKTDKISFNESDEVFL